MAMTVIRTNEIEREQLIEANSQNTRVNKTNKVRFKKKTFIHITQKAFEKSLIFMTFYLFLVAQIYS